MTARPGTGSGEPLRLPTADVDPYAWLEDVEGVEPLAWVAERNAETLDRLAEGPGFDELRDQIRAVLDSDDRIPMVTERGGWYYNFWQDAQHERGIWRRTTPELYEREDPKWQVLLDLDDLGAAEGTDWVWHGAQLLRPGFDRAMVELSRGGSDADVSREFDLAAMAFIEGGFERPEAKGSVSWVDRDTLLVTNDFGPGTMSSSGYPLQARRWRRGTELVDAPVVFEGEPSDMAIGVWHDPTPGFERDLAERQITFFSSRLFVLGKDGPRLVDAPDSADKSVWRDWLLIRLREEWRGHGPGSLLAAPLDAALAGACEPVAIFAPGPTECLQSVTRTRSHLVVTLLDNVAARTCVLTPRTAGPWACVEPHGPAGLVTVSVGGVDAIESDDVWQVTTGFLTPSTLSRGPALAAAGVGGDPRENPDRGRAVIGGTNGTAGAAAAGGATSADQAAAQESRDASAGDDTSADQAAAQESRDAGPTAGLRVLKRAPSFFDTDGLRVTQRFAQSEDGTTVPYFLVAATDLPTDGSTPTLLGGYGGFEIAETPAYSGVLGRAWLARGGAYALANIRGGGEFGPTWHQAAMTRHRHRAYEDFAAVARDLAATGVAAPERLGCMGGSNGGLLTGNMLVSYPELFGAIVIKVPLLDMHRYSHLLAGASWMAEYGDPDDPEQWEFVRTFSPYHLLDPARDYPPVLLTTSTRDDRVHPAHARKMTALLRAAGKDVTYYENTEGGHAGASTNAQQALMQALAYEFLWSRLAA